METALHASDRRVSTSRPGWGTFSTTSSWWEDWCRRCWWTRRSRFPEWRLTQALSIWTWVWRLAILHEERYRALGERLRDAGFEPDTNESGNRTLQRWRTGFSPSVTIDFLIPPSDENDVGGTQRHILPDFAAVITPGLHLAFADRVRVPIEGRTPSGEEAGRDMWVCGPGAFTVLKALAFRNRGDNKDAYDMVYVWQGVGIESVVGCLEPVVDDRHVAQALDIIRADFGTIDSIGPRRTAEFMRGMPDDDIQADAVGLADRLLTQLSGVG